MTADVPETQNLQIAGRRLEIQTYPPAAPGRPTLVLLHEGLGSIAQWKDWPRRLAVRTGCGLLLYSRYGHGWSERLGEKRAVGYMHHEGEVVLPALLDELGIVKPVLFGHSDGASIALIHAGKYPDRPLGLILEAPHVFVEKPTVSSIAEARNAFETTDLAQKLARYHSDPDTTFRGWNDIWLDPRFRSWNIESCLPAIRCPVLLIQGEDDAYGTPAQLEAIAARVRDTTILLLPECGHAPHRDRPDAVLDQTAGFLHKLAFPPDPESKAKLGLPFSLPSGSR